MLVADVAPAHVQDNAVEPALEAARVSEAAQREVRLEHGLVGQLAGRLLVADHAHGDAPGHRLVPLDEGAESASIAGACQLDKLGV